MIQIEIKQSPNADDQALTKHHEGCLICGQELVYTAESGSHQCVFCGHVVSSNTVCPEGHFVCDECHRADARELLQLGYGRTETNPIALARQFMKMPVFSMHGPEHHLLVPVVLLITLKNIGSPIDEGKIETAIKRASQLPGGICGYWGGCGAVLGAGIALSILRGSSPLKREEWGQTNRNVGEILLEVGKEGGPRCCKRTTYTTLLKAMEIITREDGIIFPDESRERPVCTDFRRNAQCLHKECSYFPSVRISTPLMNESGYVSRTKIKE